jgi:hypothetical protein
VGRKGRKPLRSNPINQWLWLLPRIFFSRHGTRLVKIYFEDFLTLGGNLTYDHSGRRAIYFPHYAWFVNPSIVSIVLTALLLAGCSGSTDRSASPPLQPNVETPAEELTLEEKYQECVDLKTSMRSGKESLGQSLLADDNDLGVWFLYYGTIDESRRYYMSERSNQILAEYQASFDRYQILQCELNFPVLQDPRPNSYGDLSGTQPDEPWKPSAVL